MKTESIITDATHALSRVHKIIDEFRTLDIPERNNKKAVLPLVRHFNQLEKLRNRLQDKAENADLHEKLSRGMWKLNSSLVPVTTF